MLRTKVDSSKKFKNIKVFIKLCLLFCEKLWQRSLYNFVRSLLEENINLQSLHRLGFIPTGIKNYQMKAVPVKGP